ncbi:DNA/RNA nuclease SfsA [Salisediminibacterium beveridgei]|uniref:Sugar fermentation stimulation protein homolog n=1 Tax=Salisediminibacterium beveridgei TaxID=632773 RepID=A0A1D7QWS5_9BACI|nr:DNA/RNA nuclease SfsA [Salisediminibacterium beveridgei]AOM83452.1 Sugar/maltose fermentation stimulation protein [Salisediminibacterium beveridgei]
MNPAEILFEEPLIETAYIARKNRFLMEVALGETGERVDVHLADSARLTELLIPGKTIYVSCHNAPHRKTNYTARLIENQDGSGLVSIFSTMPNQLAEQIIHHKLIPELASYTHKAREVRIGPSRFDHVLKMNLKQAILEVKGITWVEDGTAFFPGAVTARGKRHVEELQELNCSEDTETFILFVVQRADASNVQMAEVVDPLFSKALKNAKKSGVHVLACTMNVSTEGVSFKQTIPVITD